MLSPRAARVVGIVQQASPKAIAEGARWYPDTYEWCREVAGLSGVTPEQVAGAVAALSPRQRWDVNKRNAVKVVTAYVRGDVSAPAVGTFKQRAEAWDCMGQPDPLYSINGRKVRNFYRAITGDVDAVTVDCWVYFAVYGEKLGNTTLTGARYDECECAIRDAAAYLGLTPRECQAIVWTAVRGTGA